MQKRIENVKFGQQYSEKYPVPNFWLVISARVGLHISAKLEAMSNARRRMRRSVFAFVTLKLTLHLLCSVDPIHTAQIETQIAKTQVPKTCHCNVRVHLRGGEKGACVGYFLQFVARADTNFGPFRLNRGTPQITPRIARLTQAAAGT